MSSKIPVILLKTKSSPSDKYQEYFETLGNGAYHPIFIPVLEHQIQEDVLEQISDLIVNRSFNNEGVRRYGGIIFTSQRAVEAFTLLANRLASIGELIDETTVFYVVGPATARAVKAIGLHCPVLGEETGNGDTLAEFILTDYNTRWTTPESKPSLLFLVGEQRRDIIPKTLQSGSISPEQRIKVDEIEVYKTTEHPRFEAEFRNEWIKCNGEQCVVIFSPSGCRTMMKVLGLVDETTGKYDNRRKSETKIATIGPTTKAFLIREFDLEPDVSAPSPNPESLGNAIHAFRTKSG
jgi:uroporphyrinogen-III synthase